MFSKRFFSFYIISIHCFVANFGFDLYQFFLVTTVSNNVLSELIENSFLGFNNIVDALIRNGATVDSVNNDGATPLLLAAHNGN